MMSSLDLPPPPLLSRGWSAKIVPMSALDSARLNVMFAFSCIPKISGWSTAGSVSK